MTLIASDADSSNKSLCQLLPVSRCRLWIGKIDPLWIEQLVPITQMKMIDRHLISNAHPLARVPSRSQLATCRKQRPRRLPDHDGNKRCGSEEERSHRQG